MSKNLVIVESPAKAKTIEGYLGKDFLVKSSFGHVRDLPKDGLAVDVANGFQPSYEISPDKKKLVSELKSLAKSAEEVWLATDDDREGEAISWHLKEALGLRDNTKRIVFREITKNAILNAIKTPRTIDVDLVNAQQARRVLDRLVGYELSPVLWRKIKGGSTGLSAGRVQSVALRLVVEREREIDKHSTKSSFKVTAQFIVDGSKVLNAELPKNFQTSAEARKFLEACIGATFTIKNLEVKPAKKSPAPPFTTSTLQQEASRKLSYSVDRTMRLAQNLYEAGKISYMRTDSTNLSQEAIDKAKTEIETEFGPKYVQTRQFKTKNESAQEAHEAIRPTNFNDRNAGADRDQKRLYELIWKRAIASQMADAQLERTIVTIGIKFANGTQLEQDLSFDVFGEDYDPAKQVKFNPQAQAQNTTFPSELVAQGEVIKFDGFLRVYLESKDDEDDEEAKGMLPPLTIGQVLNLGQMKATEKFTRPQPRYAEASLVKKLEEMGIGRPSTYAPTISTIINRGYVIKQDKPGQERKYQEFTLQQNHITETSGKETFGSEKSKLFPTNTGIVVNDFLVEYFPDIVNYQFTATVEKEFDEIADGKINWQKMLEGFYGDFHKNIEEIQGSSVGSFKTGARELGLDPASGKPVSARLGKYGAYVQIGEASDEDKPRFANLRDGQLIETITLQDALDLFALPREVGFFEDKAMTIGIGKFGPYVKHDDKYVSLTKEDDPYSIDAERAIQLIQQKRAEALGESLGDYLGKPVTTGKGRFGPYVKYDEKYISLPRNESIAGLSLERAIELIEAKRQQEANKYIKEFAERPEIKVVNGQYGPYLAVGKRNVRIPKDVDPATLTLEDCLALAGDDPAATKAPAKKAAATKASGKAAATKKPAATKKVASKK
ncbi:MULTISPECIES: type I DNA topoisomerase [unclassified Spirosoma]|uniref:type I DNA topoisomerase n=1 Tax=unclassified Spirosoma TaxID=2621999 RepID=UPI000965E3B5|nr:MULTISPECIES: type I DNA topoisomerase [unclassified Spirosoma]MBN8826562.1 type I DNA topoisomerase [Spirosoma sp.]OJW71587.1 MAG: DNA topoisomerase I [Spirosoma sp. 48-14]